MSTSSRSGSCRAKWSLFWLPSCCSTLELRLPHPIASGRWLDIFSLVFNWVSLFSLAYSQRSCGYFKDLNFLFCQWTEKILPALMFSSPWVGSYSASSKWLKFIFVGGRFLQQKMSLQRVDTVKQWIGYSVGLGGVLMYSRMPGDHLLKFLNLAFVQGNSISTLLNEFWMT